MVVRHFHGHHHVVERVVAACRWVCNLSGEVCHSGRVEASQVVHLCELVVVARVHTQIAGRRRLSRIGSPGPRQLQGRLSRRAVALHSYPGSGYFQWSLSRTLHTRCAGSFHGSSLAARATRFRTYNRLRAYAITQGT